MACVRARGVSCIILADSSIPSPHPSDRTPSTSPDARRNSPTTERESEIDDRFPNKRLLF